VSLHPKGRTLEARSHCPALRIRRNGDPRGTASSVLRAIDADVRRQSAPRRASSLSRKMVTRFAFCCFPKASRPASTSGSAARQPSKQPSVARLRFHDSSHVTNCRDGADSSSRGFPPVRQRTWLDYCIPGCSAR
jgi:hypothetical protein